MYFAYKTTIDKRHKNTEEENIVFYLQSTVPWEFSLKINTPFHCNNFYTVNHVHILFFEKIILSDANTPTYTHTYIITTWRGKKSTWIYLAYSFKTFISYLVKNYAKEFDSWKTTNLNHTNAPLIFFLLFSAMKNAKLSSIQMTANI